MNRIRRLLDSLEGGQAPLGSYLLVYAGILLVRLVLEYYSSRTPFVFGVDEKFDGLHSIVWFNSVLLTLTLFFTLLTGQSVLRVLRLFLVFIGAILIAPILDLMISQGEGVKMTYLMVMNRTELRDSLFSFMGGEAPIGATAGLRIEVGLILAGLAVYVWLKRGNAALSLAALAGGYILIYLHGIFPFALLTFCEAVGLPFASGAEEFNRQAIHLLALINLLQILAIWIWQDRTTVWALVKDLRYLRIAFYLLAAALGYELIDPTQRIDLWTGDRFFGVLLTVVAFVLVVIFCIVENNLQDVAIDKISNPERPTVKGTIPVTTYRAVGWAALATGLAAAALVGFYPFFFLAIFGLLYHAYSVPPLRLKTITVAGKLVIGVNVVAMAMLGFFTYHTAERPLFPTDWIWFGLVFVTLAAQFIDLKDVAGDKAEGVRTLPVVAGVNGAKIFCALAAFASYGYVYWLMQRDFGIWDNHWLMAYGTPALALAHAASLFLRPFREWVTFVLFLGGLAVLVVFFHLHGAEAGLHLLPPETDIRLLD